MRVMIFEEQFRFQSLNLRKCHLYKNYSLNNCYMCCFGLYGVHVNVNFGIFSPSVLKRNCPHSCVSCCFFCLGVDNLERIYRICIAIQLL